MLKDQFPMDETDHDVEDVFENLLELCHHEHFGKKVRMESLSLLVTQIQLGESGLLAEMVSERPDNQVRMLVDEFISSLRVAKPLEDVHHIKDGRNFVPFLRFLLLLSRQSISAAQAVLESGYMDLVLCLCLSNFADRRLCLPNETSQDLPDAFAIALSTLSVLATHRVNHPTMLSCWSLLRRYWPPIYLAFLDQSFCHHAISQYPLVDHPLRRPLTLRRLLSVTSAFDKNDPEYFVVNNGCAELVSLSMGYFQDSEIKDLVTRALADCLAAPRFRLRGWQELQIQFSKTPYSHVVDLLFALIRCLLSGFYEAFASPLEQARERIDAFLDFAQQVTETSPTLRIAFAEAGILALKPFRLGDDQYWKIFLYSPSVPRGLRDKLVRVLDDESAMRIFSQKAL